MMNSDQSVPVPSVQGFVLNERIGTGSYSVVFKATSSGFSSDGTREVVAIKCILKHRICSTQAAQDNMVREILILKRLCHPHIVQMKDFQWDKNYIYLITEYCNGGDLSSFIHRQRCLPEPVTRKFLQQLASAMRYLRSHNICHMDLKPQNILISYSGHASKRRPVLKLGDFGFAVYLRSSDDASSLRGSPLYMAPEMFLQRGYDATVDLWSIGVILYECLFGKAPFACSTMEELVKQIRSATSIVLPDRPPISDDCRSLLLGLLERDPARRLNFDEFFAHPFVDLEHAPSEECLKKATTLIKEAIAAEEDRRTAESVRLYCRALGHFLPAIQYEEDTGAKNALRAKARQYLQHAEALQSTLMPSRRGATSSERIPSNSTTASSSITRNHHSGTGSLDDSDTATLEKAWENVPEVGALLTVISAAEESLNRGEERYEEALEKYTLSIETGLRLLSSEPKNTRRDLLRRFVDRWLDRAHELKTYVEVKKLNLSKLEEKEAVLISVEENTERMAEDRTCVLQ